MLARLVHLATAARRPFLIASPRTNRPKTCVRACVRSVFVVQVVASLAGVSPPPPPTLFSIAAASKCFGLISFEKKREKKKGAAAVMKRRVCVAPLRSSTLKNGRSVEGWFHPSASSNRSKSIFKVTFGWRVVISPAYKQGWVVWGASDPGELQITNDISCLISCATLLYVLL